MRIDDLTFAAELSKRLDIFASSTHRLPGISQPPSRRALIFQIIESIRRIRFVHQVAQRPIAQPRKDPLSEYFDPIRAAILYMREGNVDEAAWLVFLFVHFGKNIRSGYRLIAHVYGGLGHTQKWTWPVISSHPSTFRHWLNKNQQQIKSSGKTRTAFGNHRKYQSLDALKPNGTGDAIESYISWVMTTGNHEQLFGTALAISGGDPEQAFALLYRSMSAVKSFGRMAKFDYLSMVGKLGIANICPDSVHFDGATGPVAGAKLLFVGNGKSGPSVRQLEDLADLLALALEVDKQVMEDSLCNWQKNPLRLQRFRG